MPQGSSAPPGWFVKVVNEVITDLERVAAYFDDVIVFAPDPASHVDNIRALFQRHRKHHLKLSPAKATLGATDADFLGHTISAVGVSPNADRVATLTKMPMPTNVKQLRSLLGGIGYYHKLIANIPARLRPVNTFLTLGVKFIFTPAMEAIIRQLLHDLATAPILDTQTVMPLPTISAPSAYTVTPDAMASAARSIKSNRTLRQPHRLHQPRHPRQRTLLVPLDLEARSIVWAIKPLRGHLGSTKFRIYSDHKALKNIAKVGEHNARVQRWL